MPRDKAGAEVPKVFLRAAIARGCIPVGAEPREIEPDAFDRATTIRGAAKRAMANTMPPDSPTHQPPPRDEAVDPGGTTRPETTDIAAIAAHAVGASLRDRVVEKISLALQRAGDSGLTRTELRDTFHRNVPADRIGAALELLQRKGRATCESASTGSGVGRPPQVWKFVK